MLIDRSRILVFDQRRVRRAAAAESIKHRNENPRRDRRHLVTRTNEVNPELGASQARSHGESLESRLFWLSLRPRSCGGWDTVGNVTPPGISRLFVIRTIDLSRSEHSSFDYPPPFPFPFPSISYRRSMMRDFGMFSNMRWSVYRSVISVSNVSFARILVNHLLAIRKPSSIICKSKKYTHKEARLISWIIYINRVLRKK